MRTKVLAALGGMPRWAKVGGGVLGGLLVIGALASPEESSVELDATATTVDEAPTTTERQTTSTERQTTTTTEPEAPEGGHRTGDLEVASSATAVEDRVDRTDVAFDDLAVLDSLEVADESNAGSYDRSLFPHWDDDDGDGCDTRCEVLTAQMRPDGAWFSEWDGATESDTSLIHIDHVVALAEAWRSGAHAWSAADRDEFADDRANLLAVTEASNIRKSDKDAASWFPSRADANCLWALTTVTVKAEWDLSVDAAEKDALRNLLVSCGAVPPTTTTTTTSPPPPPPPPPPTAAPQPVAPPPAPANDCTPGYSPCLPPAEDYDCAGGGGNGPAYTGRVTVDHSHGDPYDLDRDRDGVGCE